MPRQILPHLEALSNQIRGIISHYVRMLDDEFLFGSATQVPQVATIFDRVAGHPLQFQGDNLMLTELLTLIAYRYGFESVRIMGHGGYALVIGHQDDTQPSQRRVLRLVPEHHVRDIIARTENAKEFDVRLTDDNEPIRDKVYPLLLSDLFLIPRHTTKLSFYDATGEILQAGGHPAVLHCQLLPEVRAFNQLKADKRMATQAGERLAAALATLGVSVADAHGGNGGVLIGEGGQPIIHHEQAEAQYIPIVLDYGYYSEIGPRTLATMLVHHGVSVDSVLAMLEQHASTNTITYADPFVEFLTRAIKESNLPRSLFGRLLYEIQPVLLNPYLWIDPAVKHWQTSKEKTYPPLHSQSRLARLYPVYDEVIFPQRIEEYTFTV